MEPAVGIEPTQAGLQGPSVTIGTGVAHSAGIEPASHCLTGSRIAKSLGVQLEPPPGIGPGAAVYETAARPSREGRADKERRMGVSFCNGNHLTTARNRANDGTRTRTPGLGRPGSDHRITFALERARGIEPPGRTWQAHLAPCGARRKEGRVKAASRYPRGGHWPGPLGPACAARLSLFWMGTWGSNPDFRVQSPASCHWTESPVIDWSGRWELHPHLMLPKHAVCC